ncbi:hypothetical protein V6N13_055834 [Hibiscus sabdariffa]
MGPGTIQLHLLHPLHVVKQMEKLLLKFIKDMGKKEGVDSLSFFGPKSEYVVSGSGNGRVYIWKKKGGELVRAKKEHVLGSIVSSLIHIPQFWLAVEPMASRYGLQMLLTKLCFQQ